MAAGIHVSSCLTLQYRDLSGGSDQPGEPLDLECFLISTRKGCQRDQKHEVFVLTMLALKMEGPIDKECVGL